MKTKWGYKKQMRHTKHNIENFVPVFAIKDISLEREDNSDADVQSDTAQVSFFDIKEMYDIAYNAINEGRSDYKAKEMMAQAIKMDMAYRCQLARQSKYKKQSQMNDFRIISSGH